MRVMRRLIRVDGGADGREEERLADPIEQSKPIQLVLRRVLELGKAELCPPFAQSVVELDQKVGGGDVDARDRFGRDDEPCYLGGAASAAARTRSLKNFACGVARTVAVP